MVTVEFYDDGKIIKGILLAKYQCPHDEINSYNKKFLWIRKLIHKKQTLTTPLYVIFIPWKHKEKEIIEIDEKYIVHPESVQADESWIKIDRFLSSKSSVNYFYPEGMEISNFLGYPFIHESNSFLINLPLGDMRDSLTILYENMPEILEVDLNNTEDM